MRTYQYQVLRYLPNRVNGEFINIGVVVFDNTGQILKGRFLSKWTRIGMIFPSADIKYLSKTLRFVQFEVDQKSEKIISELSFKTYDAIDEITKLIIPEDDSALFFSEIKRGLDISVDTIISNLYEKFVEHHENEQVC